MEDIEDDIRLRMDLGQKGIDPQKRIVEMRIVEVAHAQGVDDADLRFPDGNVAYPAAGNVLGIVCGSENAGALAYAFDHIQLEEGFLPHRQDVDSHVLQ